MCESLKHFISCAMLLTMLATFASPSFGWGMVTGHIDVPAGHDHHHSVMPDHESDHAALPADDADHKDAHTSVGHVLGHMPLNVAASSVTPLVPYGQEKPLFVSPNFPVVGYKPPIRPPRA